MEIKKEYKKTLKKYGVDVDALNRVVITENTTRADMLTGIEKSTTEIITPEMYVNIITSIPFFGDRVTRGYTPAGNIPVKLVTHFDENKTTTRNYTFKKA